MLRYGDMTAWERDLFEATYALVSGENVEEASCVITRMDGSDAPDGMLDGDLILDDGDRRIQQWIQAVSDGVFVIRWHLITDMGRKLEADFELHVVLNL